MTRRRYSEGNPTATAALKGKTLSELEAHCTDLLARPMSDDVLRRILGDICDAYRRAPLTTPETQRIYGYRPEDP